MNIWTSDIEMSQLLFCNMTNSKWVNMGVASKVYWTANEAVLDQQPSYRVAKARLVGLHDGSAGEELQKPPGDGKGGSVHRWWMSWDGWMLGWINGDVGINGLDISPTYKWLVYWGYNYPLTIICSTWLIATTYAPRVGGSENPADFPKTQQTLWTVRKPFSKIPSLWMNLGLQIPKYVYIYIFIHTCTVASVDGRDGSQSHFTWLLNGDCPWYAVSQHVRKKWWTPIQSILYIHFDNPILAMEHPSWMKMYCSLD